MDDALSLCLCGEDRFLPAESHVAIPAKPRPKIQVSKITTSDRPMPPNCHSAFVDILFVCLSEQAIAL